MPEADPSASRSFADFPASPARLETVDILRGLVMMLMALDHTRDFFTTLPFNPVDLDQTHPALFLTRWITHYCAPIFIFLAGASAFLSTTRGKTRRALCWFLFTRGVWLVLLELFYVNWFGWRFHINIHSYGVQVIWAIGWSMVALAALIWFPRWLIMTFGLAMIALHNTLDGLTPEHFGAWGGLWRIVHAGGGFEIAPGVQFFAGYPLVPWIGVMAVGYAFGPVLLDPVSRRKWLLALGCGLTALFVVLRTTNLYGDPQPWSSQQSPLFTFFSFLNCTKYPPSLCYLLMTLGPALLLLALFDRQPSAMLKPILVFGRVPLFFYLIHLPLINGLVHLSSYVRFHTATPPPDATLSLPGVYLFWIVVLALLYPVCWGFSEIKRRYHSAWLGYL